MRCMVKIVAGSGQCHLQGRVPQRDGGKQEGKEKSRGEGKKE